MNDKYNVVKFVDEEFDEWCDHVIEALEKAKKEIKAW